MKKMNKLKKLCMEMWTDKELQKILKEIKESKEEGRKDMPSANSECMGAAKESSIMEQALTELRGVANRVKKNIALLDDILRIERPCDKEKAAEDRAPMTITDEILDVIDTLKHSCDFLETLNNELKSVVGDKKILGQKVKGPGIIHEHPLENHSTNNHISYIRLLPREEMSVSKMFKDVEEGKWYTKVVEKAAKYGLMMGREKDKFCPMNVPTRAELAAVAVRLYEQTNEDFVEVIEKVLPSIVQIENDMTGGLGSGTFIHEKGYILTNAHVVLKIDRNKEGEITNIEVPNMVGMRSPERAIGGTFYAMGPVLAFDVEKDLAICKPQQGIDGGYPALPISPYSPVQSEKVLAIGSPLGLIRSVSEGVVSGYRKIGSSWYIQTEAEINPGNSGGALVNLRGELLGVPSMKMVHVAVEGINFAIAIPTVQTFIREQVKAGNLPEKVLKAF